MIEQTRANNAFENVFTQVYPALKNKGMIRLEFFTGNLINYKHSYPTVFSTFSGTELGWFGKPIE